MGAGVFDGRRNSPGVSKSTDARALKIARSLSPFDPYPICERLSGVGPEPYAPPPSMLLPHVELSPAQTVAAAKVLYKGGNLLLVHPADGGEALTAVAAFLELQRWGRTRGEMVVVTSEERIEPYIRCIEHCTTSALHFHLFTYPYFRRDPAQAIPEEADTIIYDDLQATDELLVKTLKTARMLHTNFIGLVDANKLRSPADLVPLVDAMTDGDHLLGNKDVFELRFHQNEVVREALLSPYVHYVGGKIPSGQPQGRPRDMSVEESRAK